MATSVFDSPYYFYDVQKKAIEQAQSNFEQRIAAQRQQPQGQQGQSQIPASAYLGAGQAALQLGTQIGGAIGDANAIQTGTPEQQTTDEFGTPVYNLGQQAAYVRGLNKNNYGRNLPLSGAMQGASAGAAFGPAGVIVGGIGGAIAGVIGRNAAQKKADEQITKAKRGLEAAKSSYSENLYESTQARLARDQYEAMLKNNVYNIPFYG